MREPKWYDFKKLTKDEILKLTTNNEKYNFFFKKLTKDFENKDLEKMFDLLSKARNKVEKNKNTNLEKVWLVKVSIIFKIIKMKDYIQNKERYDEHTDYMLNQLPKDLTTSKNFHKKESKRKSKTNPEQAQWHTFMTRALTEQGY